MTSPDASRSEGKVSAPAHGLVIALIVAALALVAAYLVGGGNNGSALVSRTGGGGGTSDDSGTGDSGDGPVDTDSTGGTQQNTN